MLYITEVEYGNFCINHVLGCAHGCKYPCYAFSMAKRYGKVNSYEQWCEPVIVTNALEVLKKQIPKLINKIKSVQLCFTTDPFMYHYKDVNELSLEIIELLNSYEIKVTVLTKGLLPIELANFSKENEYGISLVSLNEDFRKDFEPNTAPFKDRIQSLKNLSEKGCKTWVSIEPYPTPNILKQDYAEILNKISFVDKIIFGRLHYNKKVSDFKNYQLFYNQLASQTVEFCKSNNIDYHIKEKTVKVIK